MGSPDMERGRDADEGPVHEVVIDYDFFMGETEVTQAQWEAVMGYNALTHLPDGTPLNVTVGVGRDYPVGNVSWDDCQAFLSVLNTLGEGTFRLPSEAEWEYACRAGSSTRFFFGDSLGCLDDCSDCEAGKQIIVVDQRSDYMWYCSNAGGTIRPVRQLLPNFFGLYDMTGNVSEWCQDRYHSDYEGAPTDGTAWEPGDEIFRVFRGGAAFAHAVSSRSASRDKFFQDIRGGASSGFRLVRDF